MNYNLDKHHRHSIRLRGYDYSQNGAYFVTICAQNSECLFGNIADGKMVLNEAGQHAQGCWMDIPTHFPGVELDEFVIMPDHVHGIVVINRGSPVPVGANDYLPCKKLPHPDLPTQDPHVRANNHSPLQWRGTAKTIGSIVRGFKIGVTKWFRQDPADKRKIWQRNYHEHIIRDESSLEAIRAYIANNPKKWKKDDPIGPNDYLPENEFRVRANNHLPPQLPGRIQNAK